MERPTDPNKLCCADCGSDRFNPGKHVDLQTLLRSVDPDYKNEATAKSPPLSAVSEVTSLSAASTPPSLSSDESDDDPFESRCAELHLLKSQIQKHKEEQDKKTALETDINGVNAGFCSLLPGWCAPKHAYSHLSGSSRDTISEMDEDTVETPPLKGLTPFKGLVPPWPAQRLPGYLERMPSPTQPLYSLPARGNSTKRSLMYLEQARSAQIDIRSGFLDSEQRTKSEKVQLPLDISDSLKPAIRTLSDPNVLTDDSKATAYRAYNERDDSPLDPEPAHNGARTLSFLADSNGERRGKETMKNMDRSVKQADSTLRKLEMAELKLERIRRAVANAKSNDQTTGLASAPRTPISQSDSANHPVLSTDWIKERRRKYEEAEKRITSRSASKDEQRGLCDLSQIDQQLESIRACRRYIIWVREKTRDVNGMLASYHREFKLQPKNEQTLPVVCGKDDVPTGTNLGDKKPEKPSSKIIQEIRDLWKPTLEKISQTLVNSDGVDQHHEKTEAVDETDESNTETEQALVAPSTQPTDKTDDSDTEIEEEPAAPSFKITISIRTQNGKERYKLSVDDPAKRDAQIARVKKYVEWKATEKGGNSKVSFDEFMDILDLADEKPEADTSSSAASRPSGTSSVSTVKSPQYQARCEDIPDEQSVEKFTLRVQAATKSAMASFESPESQSEVSSPPERASTDFPPAHSFQPVHGLPHVHNLQVPSPIPHAMPTECPEAYGLRRAGRSARQPVQVDRPVSSHSTSWPKDDCAHLGGKWRFNLNGPETDSQVCNAWPEEETRDCHERQGVSEEAEYGNVVDSWDDNLAPEAETQLDNVWPGHYSDYDGADYECEAEDWP